MTAVRLPNFFVAGAPKAGTTSLFFYLRQHPQVYMSPIKGPTYFGGVDLLNGPERKRLLRELPRHRAALPLYLDGTRVSDGMPLVLDWDDYLKLFRNVRGETAIGEASVSYLRLPSAAAAIRAAVPAARLVFVLRDPAERLFSVISGALGRGSGATFRARLLPPLDAQGRSTALVDGGRYGTHLQRWFDLFPREQVRVYLYEDYRADARAVLRDIFAFLGVDPAYRIDVSRRHNETVVPRFPTLHALRRRLLRGAGTPGWIPEAARGALRRLYRRRKEQMTMDPADRRMVIDYYREEIEQTAALIGRDLSAWLR